MVVFHSLSKILPAGGVWKDDRNIAAVPQGRYWSTTITTSNTSSKQHLYFILSDKIIISDEAPYSYGLSIRGIQ